MWEAIAAIIGLISAGVGAAISMRNNDENLDYAKSVTQEQHERDDTSYQRTVKDVTAAGFSPLAALDGGLVPNSSPLGYQGQAPQFDLNSTIQSFLQAGQQHFQSKESVTRHQERIDELDHQFENNLKELDISLTTQYENNLSLQDKAALDSLNLVQAQLQASKDLESTKSALALQNTQKEYLIHLGVTDFVEFSDWDQYVNELYDYADYINNGILDYKQNYFKVPESNSGSGGVSVVGTGVNGSNAETRSISVETYVCELYSARPFPEFVGNPKNKKPLTEAQKEKINKLRIDINKLSDGGFTDEEKSAMPKVPDWEKF